MTEPETHFTVVTVHGLTFPCCRECGALVLDGQTHIRWHNELANLATCTACGWVQIDHNWCEKCGCRTEWRTDG